MGRKVWGLGWMFLVHPKKSTSTQRVKLGVPFHLTLVLQKNYLYFPIIHF